jgi:hypothetical protein
MGGRSGSERGEDAKDSDSNNTLCYAKNQKRKENRTKPTRSNREQSSPSADKDPKEYMSLMASKARKNALFIG